SIRFQDKNQRCAAMKASPRHALHKDPGHLRPYLPANAMPFRAARDPSLLRLMPVPRGTAPASLDRCEARKFAPDIASIPHTPIATARSWAADNREWPVPRDA